jgi:hypothetical protein
MSTGYALEGGEQEVIQALAGMPGVHGHVLYPRAGAFGRGISDRIHRKIITELQG